MAACDHSLGGLLRAGDHLLHYFLELAAQEDAALREEVAVVELSFRQGVTVLHGFEGVEVLVLVDSEGGQDDPAVDLVLPDLHSVPITVLPSVFLTGFCSP